MSERMWFSGGGERVRETFETALAWCEGCWIVSDAPTAARRGDALWGPLLNTTDRVRAAILSNLDAADIELLAPFYEANRVRRLIEGTRGRGHFISFERGDEIFVIGAWDSEGQEGTREDAAAPWSLVTGAEPTARPLGRAAMG